MRGSTVCISAKTCMRDAVVMRVTVFCELRRRFPHIRHGDALIWDYSNSDSGDSASSVMLTEVSV